VAFRSVFVDGKISNPKTGRTASLSLLGEGDVIPYVSSVSLRQARNVNQEMSVTFSPPYEKALKMVAKDSEWLRLGNTLGIRWGYADMGMVTDWFYGFMTQPQISFDAEISVTVEATTLAWNTDRVERIRDWASVDEPKSLKTIAETIAARYGLDVEFNFNVPLVEASFNEERSSFVQGGRTDLQFLMMEAERVGARLVSLNQKLIFVDASGPTSGEDKVSATFVMFGDISLDSNRLPLKSFSPNSMGALFLSNFQGVNALPYGPNSDPEEEVARVTAANDDTDPRAFDTGGNAFTSEDTVAIPPKDDGNPPQGIEGVNVKSTIKVDRDSDEGGRNTCLPLDGQETEDFIKAQLAAISESNAGDHGVSASCSSIAIPNLLPGMYVKVLGVGDYFSGTYMIKELETEISGGGAEMKYEIFARGFPGVSASADAFHGKEKKAVEPSEFDKWFDNATDVMVNGIQE
jgi:phage protein D